MFIFFEKKKTELLNVTSKSVEFELCDMKLPT